MTNELKKALEEMSKKFLLNGSRDFFITGAEWMHDARQAEIDALNAQIIILKSQVDGAYRFGRIETWQNMDATEEKK